MKAIATVKETYPNGTALVEVTRKSACSGDCGSCHGCAHPEERVRVTAQNPVYADAGDQVMVESATGAILGWASLLYLLPIALMLAGVLAPASAESVNILLGLAGLLAGLLVCMLISRKSKKIRRLTFTITGILSPGVGLSNILDGEL